MTGTTRRLLAWPHELHRSGILGINRRNLDYVQKHNPREKYPRVDNKLLTKQICQAHGIPIPETYAVIARHGDIKRFAEIIGDREQFVVKPACGAGGRGIQVIAERRDNAFLTPSGRRILLGDLRYHLSTILSGLYSLGGQVDQAIVEQRIIMHPVFDRIAVGGTPDVRIILYRGVPVMAMIRLPTTQSGGRANLHQGAIAAAVHLVRGETFGGVCKDRAVQNHPDTNANIAGVQIPGWRNVLNAAMNLGDALEMGYLGVDFVVDAEVGPVVLEANARPGLAIQVAHRQGLLQRLHFVDRQSADARQGERRHDLIAQLADM